MRITFLGAAHEVTGSCTYVECGKTRFIVDCGMEQGRDMFENQSLPISPSQVDFALLTHAHIDHSGLLPLLAKNGFTGSVYATAATCSLADIMLRDSAHIQMSEAEYKTRKAQRAGGAAVEPLYDTEDVAALTKNLRPCSYGEVIQVAEGVAVRFTDVGHLLGSACIEVWLSEGGERRKIVFSGDVGNLHQPILRDPQLVSGADYVVVESTYGARLHTGGQPDYIGELTKVIQRTLDRGGNVVIPSFAVGRTQEMLYFIREIKERGLVHGHDGFKVYVDSPLAVEATSVFLQCDASFLDEETRAILARGVNPLSFDGLEVSVSAAELGNQFLEKIEGVAESVSSLNWKNAVLLSDGEGFGITGEAALAFNEISLTPAVYKHLLDIRHGPIVLVDDSTLVIARLDQEQFSYQRDLVCDLVKRGAHVIVVSDAEVPRIDGVYANLTFGCSLNQGVVNAIMLPVAQLFSYYRALKLNKDPDKPEGLEAWIKL